MRLDRSLLLLGLATLGCTDGGSPVVPPTGQLIGVAVTPQQPTLRVGDTLRLTARSLPSGYEPFTWSTSNATIAGITANGLITAHDTGTVAMLALSTRDSAVAGAAVVRVTRGP